jgi:hypothetical protein
VKAEYQEFLASIDAEIESMRRGDADPHELLLSIRKARSSVQTAIQAVDQRRAAILLRTPQLRNASRSARMPLPPRSERSAIRPREHRSGRRHVTRGSPDDPDPDSAPDGDTAVNAVWQAALEHLTADWQFRHVAHLCLLRSRWLRRWRP